MIFKNVRVKSCKIDEPNDNDKYQLIFAVDDKKDHKKLVKMIDDDWAENGTKKKPDNLAYFKSEPNDDYPDDEDAGKIIFIATMNAEIELKSGKTKEQHVPVFKANGVEYEEIPNIGAGTIINLSTDAYTWKWKKTEGTKLNLNKIQVIDLVEYSGGDTFGNESGEKFEDEPKKKKKGKKAKEADEDEMAEPTKKKKKKKKNKAE